MTCADLDDRLFDEDCRTALLGRAPTPADVAAHLAACAACCATWSEAVDDAHRLSHLLVATPPPALRARLLDAFRLAPIVSAPWQVTEALSWAIAGGVVCAIAVGSIAPLPGFPEWAGFGMGVGVGLLAGALRRGKVIRRWKATGDAVARLALRLAQGI